MSLFDWLFKNKQQELDAEARERRRAYLERRYRGRRQFRDAPRDQIAALSDEEILEFGELSQHFPDCDREAYPAMVREILYRFGDQTPKRGS